MRRKGSFPLFRFHCKNSLILLAADDIIFHKSSYQLQEGIGKCKQCVFNFWGFFGLNVGLVKCYLVNLQILYDEYGLYLKGFIMPSFHGGFKSQERTLLEAAIFALHGHVFPETSLESVT